MLNIKCLFNNVFVLYYMLLHSRKAILTTCIMDSIIIIKICILSIPFYAKALEITICD